jgi:hypothetical protein
VADALRYWQQGFSLIPLASGVKVPVKGSRIKPYYTRPPTRQELEAWFSRERRNLGLMLGIVSQALVLDVDGESGRAFLRRMPAVPSTPTVLTPGGGLQYFFQRPLLHDTPWATHITVKPGIDLLGEGHFAVVPPSWLRPYQKQGDAHWHTGTYRWVDGVDPTRLRADMAELPDWLIEIWRAADRRPSMTARDHTPRGHSSLTIKSSGIVLSLPPSLSREALLSLVMDREVAWRCAAHMQLTKTPEDVGQWFCCALPGHGERRPSARLSWGRGRDALSYYDAHQRSGRPWYLLPEVYCALITKEVPPRLNHPSLVTWRLRLYVEAGILGPYPVEMKPPPEGASDTLRKVYTGFRLLLQSKWLKDPGQPTWFSREFAAGWCQTTSRPAGEAKEELLRLGILKVAGRGGRTARTTLYLPG